MKLNIAGCCSDMEMPGGATQTELALVLGDDCGYPPADNSRVPVSL